MDTPKKDAIKDGLKWIKDHSQEISLAAGAAAAAASKKGKDSTEKGEYIFRGAENLLGKTSTAFSKVAASANENAQAIAKDKMPAWSPVKLVIAGFAIGFAVGYLASRDGE